MPNSPSEICLPSSLGLVDSGPLLTALRDSLIARNAVRVDGAAVERISTPCIQLLVAAALNARSEGLVFELASPSSALNEALADLGVAQFLTPTES